MKKTILKFIKTIKFVIPLVSLLLGSGQINAIEVPTMKINSLIPTGSDFYTNVGNPEFTHMVSNPYRATNSDLFVGGNGRICKLNAITGILSDWCGSGSNGGHSGDGFPYNDLAHVKIGEIENMCFDTSGNFYFIEWDWNTIRKVDAAGIIHTIAGIPSLMSGSYSGDGGLAINAHLNGPVGIAYNATNNCLYFSDNGNNVVRYINLATGIINTYAGNGSFGYSGDGSLAILAKLGQPRGLAFDEHGNLYVADQYNNVIRKIMAGSATITTFAGNGIGWYSGDGGLATAAELQGPESIVFDKAGNLYISDEYNNVVRKIDMFGIINTVAGNNSLGGGYSGDGGLAINAQLNNPFGLAINPTGNLFICDGFGNPGDMDGNYYSYLREVCMGGVPNVSISTSATDSLVLTAPITYSATVSSGSYITYPGSYNVTYAWYKHIGTDTVLAYTSSSDSTFYDPSPVNGESIWCSINIAGYGITDFCSSPLNNSNLMHVTTGAVQIKESGYIAQSKEVIFPNPNNGRFQCEFISESDCELELIISDLLGRVIQKQTVTATRGANSVKLYLPDNFQKPSMVIVSIGNNEIRYANVKVKIVD